MQPRPQFLLLTLTAMLFVPLARPARGQDSSHARIVHLSFVEGEVTVARPDLEGWAQAPVNTPLQEGFKVATGDNSFAELAFENGDTLREGQSAVLSLGRLVETASGSRNSRVELQQGYATLHTLREDPNDAFELSTPAGMLTVRGAALIRVDLDQGAARVEVFQGAVDVRSNRGSWTLASDSVLVLQPDAAAPGEVSRGITEDDWDHWVQDRERRVETTEAGSVPNTTSSDDSETAAGWNELLQYGNWSYQPDGGYGWMPSTVPPGWTPYSTGQWCYYPAWGYTWIASEPWGWLPFHYGGWEFVPGTGWMWFPGRLGSWSPAQVNWYTGPGWLGWAPRPRPGGPHQRPCEPVGVCGGLAMTVAAFSKGGMVNLGTALAVSPATGERVSRPPVAPTTAIMLPGPPATRAAGAVSAGDRMGITTTTVETPSNPPRHAGAPPNSNIIYDPQNHSYVNSRAVVSTPPSKDPNVREGLAPTPPAGATRVEPVPVGNRGLTPATAPGAFRPGPSRENAATTWGLSSPRSNAPAAAAASSPHVMLPPQNPHAPAAGGAVGAGRGAASSAHGGGVPAGAGHH